LGTTLGLGKKPPPSFSSIRGTCVLVLGAYELMGGVGESAWVSGVTVR